MPTRSAPGWMGRSFSLICPMSHEMVRWAGHAQELVVQRVYTHRPPGHCLASSKIGLPYQTPRARKPETVLYGWRPSLCGGGTSSSAIAKTFTGRARTGASRRVLPKDRIDLGVSGHTVDGADDGGYFLNLPNATLASSRPVIVAWRREVPN